MDGKRGRGQDGDRGEKGRKGEYTLTAADADPGGLRSVARLLDGGGAAEGVSSVVSGRGRARKEGGVGGGEQGDRHDGAMVVRVGDDILDVGVCV